VYRYVVNLQTYTRAHKFLWTHTHTHTHAHTYEHTHMHTHIHTQIHTQHRDHTYPAEVEVSEKVKSAQAHDECEQVQRHAHVVRSLQQIVHTDVHMSRSQQCVCVWVGVCVEDVAECGGRAGPVLTINELV
jgi:hypothetical protein